MHEIQKLTASYWDILWGSVKMRRNERMKNRNERALNWLLGTIEWCVCRTATNIYIFFYTVLSVVARCDGLWARHSATCCVGLALSSVPADTMHATGHAIFVGFAAFSDSCGVALIRIEKLINYEYLCAVTVVTAGQLDRHATKVIKLA